MPELCEKEPSKLEWLLAFVVLFVPFVSFCYGDTVYFIMYELKFAQAILHGNLREAYEPVLKVVSASGVEISSLSLYDLPLNLVFGIWGIPLYLYASRSGTLVIDFPGSFWQMLYGKSILLIAFIFSAVLVYKICRAIEISGSKSRWGAYIYFSSAMAVNSVAFCGQCDVFAICLTLLGILAYIRNEDKKFLLWFIIAAQFKQFALFVFIPLMLLRDKNLFRAAGRLSAIVAAGLFFNGCIMAASPQSFRRRAGFTAGMLKKLLSDKLPLFQGDVSLFVLAFGALCIYCWLHQFRDKNDKAEANSYTVFVSLLSMVVFFTAFPSYPYWYLQMIPYISIAAVYCPRNTARIILFEAIGIGAVILSNYVIYYWCYTPNNSVNMLIHNMIGNPAFKKVSTAFVLAREAAGGSPVSLPVKIVKALYLLKPVFEAVYIACMYACVYLAYPYNALKAESLSIRKCALLRIVFNVLVCSVPFILIFISQTRS